VPTSVSHRPKPDTDDPLVIAHESEGCVVAYWHNISIVVWGTQGTLELAKELEAVSEHIRSRYERLSSIHLVVNDPPLPTAAGREKLNEIVVRFGPRAIAVATVLTGDGFWASAMRGFLTSLHWVAGGRKRYKQLTCGTVGEVARWLAPLHSAEVDSVVIDAGELENLLVRLRNRPSVQRHQK
jgi:hypothetical protein